MSESSNIEDLVLETEIQIPEEVDYTFIKSKIDNLADNLREETKDSFEIKSGLQELKRILLKHPTMVHELLPEDIGVMSKAIMEATNKFIIDTETKKGKRGRKPKAMSKDDIQKVLDEGAPDDF